MNTQRLIAVFAAGLMALTAIGSQTLASEQAGANVPADSAEHKFELAKQYYGQCTNTEDSQFDDIRPQLKVFTDMEVMAETMADPARFMQLMAVVNDPRTMHVMTKCATEPVMWDTWMAGMTDFNKMSRTMGHFMNPNLYFNWMMAPMNPAMYQPMMQMATPEYYNRWMSAMMNPAFYQPVTSLADPNWYTPRMNWMMNPQSMQPMFNMMNMGNTMATQTVTDGAVTAPAE
ncbi:MAG: hypothetical protein GY875_15260 [Gammaproteobacteria bacterium]|nr:hypothetical protein [Gammaproteobacteria bacterium]